MEMLETALKHSINQCLREKLLKHRHTSGLGEILELKLREESQMRAFITQFKIELNNLMGLKWIKANRNSGDDSDGEEEEEEEEDGNSINHSFDENEDTLIAQVLTANGGPVIKLNGKHSGLYKLSEQDNKSGSDFIMNSMDTDVDDGYRSMNQCNFKNSIIHQLNEIKSRLIDLVHEVDEKVESRLAEIELDLYRRRRNVLIEKLDNLLDILSGKASDTSQYSLPNSVVSSEGTSSHSSLNPTRKLTNGFKLANYEEQEQTINYSDSSLDVDCSTTHSKEVKDGLAAYRKSPTNEVGTDCKLSDHKSLKKPSKCSSFSNQQHMPSSSTASTYSTSSHTSSSSFL